MQRCQNSPNQTATSCRHSASHSALMNVPRDLADSTI